MKDFRASRIEKRQCPSCDAAVVNGTYCHEAGCQDGHLFVTRGCPWCGQSFKPETRSQEHCSPGCYYAFHNLEFQDEA